MDTFITIFYVLCFIGYEVPLTVELTRDSEACYGKYAFASIAFAVICFFLRFLTIYMDNIYSVFPIIFSILFVIFVNIKMHAKEIRRKQIRTQRIKRSKKNW